MSWLTRNDQVSSLQRELATVAARLSLSQSEMRRLRRALDALPIGVVLADAHGNVQVRNAMSEAFSGHTLVLVWESIERHLRAAAGGTPSGQVVEFFGPPRRVFQIDAVPLNEGGALATVEEISERARVDRVRTDFVANISHELKTPVGAMAVLAEALTDAEDPQVVSRLAQRVSEEAHRAARTIDDLLELSRIELGGPALCEAVSVDVAIADAIGRNRTAAEHRHVAVHAPSATELVVWGDSRQLVSALANLIDNAVKYSDEHSDVTVGARADNGTVMIDVIDHGVGIPATDVDRIFERFYRVDPARSRATGGTGLGLSIVRHVAANHGGRVTVTSREGEGSTFTLHLPGRAS